MKNKKLFVLLPDGVGFRNFAYSSFYKLAVKDGFDVVFWNATSFPLSELGFPEIKINSLKLHPLTDIYKKAKVQVELNLSIQRANDKVYDSYRFPFSYSAVMQAAKSVAVTLLTAANSSESGWLRIRNRIKKQERKTAYYQHCLETLQKARKPRRISQKLHCGWVVCIPIYWAPPIYGHNAFPYIGVPQYVKLHSCVCLGCHNLYSCI